MGFTIFKSLPMQTIYHFVALFRNWKELKGTLNQDMNTLSAYLQIRRLKLSFSKIMTTSFHLNIGEAKRWI